VTPQAPGPSGGGWLRFRAVSKHFSVPGDDAEPVHAARSVDLAIGPDEAVGVIGPNGAGKSTLLRMAAGVSAPTAGEIDRHGRTCSVIELGVGIHPDLTGRENVALLATLFDLDATALAARWDDIVAFSGLAHAIDQPARTYSTGMLARLSFSVAVHTDPDLLLLDEVLSVGDAEFQQRCRQRIAELRRTGTTVVLVSHDLGLVGEVCERAVLLVDGRIEADGPADAVIRRYVGLPTDETGHGPLDAEVAAAIVTAGDAIELRLHHQAADDDLQVRVDLVVREHPTFLGVGQSLAVVFGTATVPAPPTASFGVRLDTAGVPTGRFEVQVALEDRTGHAVASRSIPVTLVGEEGPFAIRLRGGGEVHPGGGDLEVATW
jgi:ABC-type polysaccharide/polyol phosphate transport system ATPase subunit